jgi:uncharacterized protein YneF (UPF0154 family)
MEKGHTHPSALCTVEQIVQIILGILVILINLVIYGLFLAKRGAKRNADE